ncbi:MULTISPECIES: phosphoenolpyruvate hydrolase family protein [Bradyrhizobium]|uniref:Transcriptional regulator n=3 Tax=Bradyrhizobium TaxID=374 RepID=A0A410VIM2_9BRAD|nr:MULTISPECIES: phosphoenolpyruvate hydrolase family protein [Bradyrhizobium]MCG2628078.1 phosphoenolpyruvate hydrolase family protein [Bradyrhizobium zhengyangense]MCG2643197.1 phosphoenolpyruvate hydrolase family protein [Bradyrhizobium zhengyangense]MCG2670489.1 phosphoenolpyruvate hydrolase family protein [Bradyrhizobium zhengyangense]MDN4985776.1 phosphoenolpyruvate hydrolase family protein [Bradyrhizobium sp. WYCCWR 13022]MDT4736617.1 phosphoenolpyruvate hydrolase family protein [Bradyr
MHNRVEQVKNAGIRQFFRNSRSFVLGAGIGSGMTARAAERAGADFVLALNAGRFRAMGGSSPASILPIRDSNEFVAGFGRTEILPSTKLPVFFGACTFDPRLDLDRFLDRIIRWGFTGVTNFPSVIHIDDFRRSLLEKSGLGYEREIELLTKARQRGLMTIAYTRSQAEARRMVEAGIEAICINFNLNRSVESGSDPSISQSELAARTSAVTRVAHSTDKNVICLLGGGPITKPDELLDICRETGVQGFIGGSSLDRVPLEMSVLEVTSGFKTIHLLREKVDLLERQLQLSGFRHGVIAQSSVMKRVLETAKRLAANPNPVLVWGETGSGKRRIANLVHSFSDRKHTKAALFQCRAGPAAGNIGALFGAERDETRKRQLSILEAANGTAVLLLHLDQLPRDGQERLADYLETGGFAPLNGVSVVRSNARIIATATIARSASLQTVLCPRLLALFTGLDIALPALPDRLEDLPQLVQHFTVEAKGDSNAPTLGIENSAFLALAGHDWPGNLRELRQIVNQLVTLQLSHITADVLRPLLTASSAVKRTNVFSEREWIIEGLKRNKLHRGKTAQSLGLSRKTLYNKIKKLRILE